VNVHAARQGVASWVGLISMRARKKLSPVDVPVIVSAEILAHALVTRSRWRCLKSGSRI
jgi:hypothetical protein